MGEQQTPALTFPSTRTPNSRRARLLLGWILSAVLILLLAACGTPAAPESPANPTEAQAPSAAEPAGEPAAEPAAEEPAGPMTSTGDMTLPVVKPEEDAETIRVKWQESPHASTFVLDEAGNNSTCARCHAPANWFPSMDEMPESCYACKFEVDPPPPLINEADWEHVACKVCHQVKKDEVQPEIAWLEVPPIEEYSQVETPEQLCMKCHTQVDVPGHAGIEVGGAHAEMACTDCHDAHGTAANCADTGCHAEAAATGSGIPGHDEDHQMVSCSACHDAGNLEVGPDASGTWVTFNPQPANEEAAQDGFTSHNTVKEAPCERCHFSGNPWELNLVEESEP